MLNHKYQARWTKAGMKESKKASQRLWREIEKEKSSKPYMEWYPRRSVALEKVCTLGTLPFRAHRKALVQQEEGKEAKVGVEYMLMMHPVW